MDLKPTTPTNSATQESLTLTTTSPRHPLQGLSKLVPTMLSPWTARDLFHGSLSMSLFFLHVSFSHFFFSFFFLDKITI